MLKKPFKFIGIFLGLLVFIIGVSLINHKIQLSKEDKLFVPFGQMIEVKDSKLHIYTEGQGDEVLVFMAGGGTSSPVLDFKSLYSLLSDKYHIVVVEKAGYGFSEISKSPRDINTILEETREGLSKAGLKSPFILFPHSMSAIEALYWAQEYPSEVKAIVGLDMAPPNAYKDYKVNKTLMRASVLGSKIGITRFFPSLADDSAAIKYSSLTDKEKDIYRAIFYRRTLSQPMFKEVQNIKENALKVKNIPKIPILSFVSNGQGTGWDKEEWIGFQNKFINEASGGKMIQLDCSHYIHDIEYEKISKEADLFIEDINMEK